MKIQVITVVMEVGSGVTMTKAVHHHEGRDLRTALALEGIVPPEQAQGVADRLEKLGEHTTPTTRIKLHTLEA